MPYMPSQGASDKEGGDDEAQAEDEEDAEGQEEQHDQDEDEQKEVRYRYVVHIYASDVVELGIFFTVDGIHGAVGT